MGVENYYKTDLPNKPRRLRMWVMIAAIIVMLVALGVINLSQSEQGQRLLGTGSVVGIVVDESDNPIDAELYVLRTDIASHTVANGSFEIHGVPSGMRSLVVARQGGGMEYPVSITTGGTTDMGRIKFMGTRVPNQ